MVNYESLVSAEQVQAIKKAISKMNIDPKPTFNEFSDYIFGLIDEGVDFIGGRICNEK